MHALSLGTWWIHVTSVLEWILAIIAVESFGRRRQETGWRWLALAMLPALVSAMAACTWFNLLRLQRRSTASGITSDVS